jgi:hypothetical protein
VFYIESGLEFFNHHTQPQNFISVTKMKKLDTDEYELLYDFDVGILTSVSSVQ